MTETSEQISDYLSKEELAQIEQDAKAVQGAKLDCRELTDNPQLQNVGAGYTRCVFITPPDSNNVVKIARNEPGLNGNKKASRIMNINESRAEQTFAVPKEVSENKVALLQEEVTTLNESGRITRAGSRSLKTTTDELDEKLDEVAEKDQIRCLDTVPENIGLKGESPVLTDLGECKSI